jgi:hypothetical protein
MTSEVFRLASGKMTIWSLNALSVIMKADCFIHTTMCFFGDKEISGRIGSPNPIVKFGNCVSDEEVSVPDEVRQWRKDVKIDFGRLDYVDAGEKYFLIDVNTTEGGGDKNYEYSEEMDLLASGLEFYWSDEAKVA